MADADKGHHDTHRRAQNVAKDVLESLALGGWRDPMDTAVGAVILQWRAQPHPGLLEASVRAHFRPWTIEYYRHVPKLTVGGKLESGDGEAGGGFRPLDQKGGARDVLTPAIVDAINKDETGVAFLGPGGAVVDRAGVVIFALGTGADWPYVVVKYRA